MSNTEPRGEQLRTIYEWLSENNPAALELCPYKIDGRHLSLVIKGESLRVAREFFENFEEWIDEQKPLA